MESQDTVGQRSSQRNFEEDDEEINIYLRLIKTIGVRIKKSETVRNLKAMLNEKEGISECLQELFFGSDQLRDDCRLVDCGIQQNSTLNAFIQNSVPLRLNIKIPSRKRTIVVEAKTYDSIQNVKSLIAAREGVHSDDFHLVYAGKPLEDDKTLSSLNIPGEPTLYMVFTPKDLVPIHVKMPNGEILEMEVNVLHTVCDVKTIVESMVGFPLDDLRLTFNGIQLMDSQTLYYYNIQEESNLEMSSQTIQVFLRDGHGKTHNLLVCRKDLVKDVKDKIFHKLGIPTRAQFLVFEGKCLNDDQTLDSYNIQKDCTLKLALRTSAFIQWKTLSELGFSNRNLRRNCRKISDLKTMIEDVIDASVKELCLPDGRVLDMDSSLSDYDINRHTSVAIATFDKFGLAKCEGSSSD